MATTRPAARKTRSGSRAPANPKTKAQRLTRGLELTQRIDVRLGEVEALSKERNAIVEALRNEDGVTYREMGEAWGKSEQAIHKAHKKHPVG